jgi:hypothetical protein
VLSNHNFSHIFAAEHSHTESLYERPYQNAAVFAQAYPATLPDFGFIPSGLLILLSGDKKRAARDGPLSL